jgi:hypothetical protein
MMPSQGPETISTKAILGLGDACECWCRDVGAGMQTNNGRYAQILGLFLIEGKKPSISETSLSSK